jgi:phospholipid N-methyltransferase
MSFFSTSIGHVIGSLTQPFSKLVNNEISSILKRQDKISFLEIGPGPSLDWQKFIGEHAEKVEVTLMEATPDLIKKDEWENFTVSFFRGHAPSDLAVFGDNVFDLVVCKNVIEHLPKHEGYLLLYEIDRICKFSSVLFTPNSFTWQPSSPNAPFNAHLSGWTPRELKQLGWSSQKGHVGLKSLFGPFATLKIESPFLLKFSGLSYPLAQLFPRFCYAFSAVKRLKNARLEEI